MDTLEMNINNEREPYWEYMGRRLREENDSMTLNKAQRSIWVTFKKEGIHKYPGAENDPKLATGDWDDVSFLSLIHI